MWFGIDERLEGYFIKSFRLIVFYCFACFFSEFLSSVMSVRLFFCKYDVWYIVNPDFVAFLKISDWYGWITINSYGYGEITAIEIINIDEALKELNKNYR